MSFDRKQDTITDKVRDLVRDHPECIGDYRKLVQYYHYYVDGLKLFIPLKELEKVTQPESITRAFRKLVEDGVIQPDQATKNKRAQQERHFHDYYSPARHRQTQFGEPNEDI